MKNDLGDIDILVNNAGIVTGKKFMECPDSLIQKTMDVNAAAHFWVGCRLRAVHKVRHAIFGQFLPPSLSHFVTHPGNPRGYVTHFGPPIFSRPSTNNPDKSPCTNSLSIVREGFCPGVLSGGLLSGVVFVHSPFCQNTSVTTES